VKRIARTCGEKCRNMCREVQEHVERIAGTCGEKRRNMWREAQEHVARSTIVPRYASTCKSKTAVGNCRPSIPFHESHGFLKQFKNSNPSKTSRTI